MTTDLLAHVEAHARHPQQPFLWTTDGAVQSRGDLARLSAALAHALLAAGLGKGDRVVVQVDKTPGIVALYLACLRTGVVFLPLNPAYTQAETLELIADAGPALIVAGTDRARALAEAEVRDARIITLTGPGSLSEAAEGLPGTFAAPEHGADDLAAILYTSGTTGRSKGVMLTRGNLASNAEALADLWRFGESDVLLHALPVFHTHGLFVATNTTLVAGGAMIWLPAFEAGAVLTALPRATVMMGVPTYYSRLLAQPGLTRAAVAHMRLFVSGSAPLSPATFAEWEARTGMPILERYGMTETNMITSNPYDGPRIAGTVGRPLPGVEVRICDPATGAPLPEGEVGRIEVRGPNVFAGYWRLPEKTAEEFTGDGFFVTGDLGSLDAAGYLRIMGREKDLVITGGLNVYPAEVEAALDALPGVAASAVIGLPHPDFGEAVVACVTPRPGAAPDEAAIRADLRERLAAFKIPKRVIVLGELPRNAMGKVQKAALRAAHAGLFTDGPGRG